MISGHEDIKLPKPFPVYLGFCVDIRRRCIFAEILYYLASFMSSGGDTGSLWTETCYFNCKITRLSRPILNLTYCLTQPRNVFIEFQESRFLKVRSQKF